LPVEEDPAINAIGDCRSTRVGSGHICIKGMCLSNKPAIGRLVATKDGSAMSCNQS